MILLIDNRDSFTFNLAQYLLELGQEVLVRRASEWTWQQALALDPDGVLTGPGPGHPADAQLSIDLAVHWPANKPLLGVCLGHQALALAFGGRIQRCKQPWHGRSAALQHDGQGLFDGLPDEFLVGRYHSLTVEESSVPSELMVTARTPDGEVQALQHRSRLLFGVQFHPESILSEHGHALLANFVRMTEAAKSR